MPAARLELGTMTLERYCQPSGATRYGICRSSGKYYFQHDHNDHNDDCCDHYDHNNDHNNDHNHHQNDHNDGH